MRMSGPGSCQPPVRRRGWTDGLCPKPHSPAVPGPPTGEPSSGPPETVFQVTLLQRGSNKTLRADCVDVTVEAQSAVSAGARRPGPRSGHTLAGHTCPSARRVACEGVSGGDRGTETPQTPGCTRASFRGSFGRVCAMLAPRLPEYTPGSYVRFLAWGFQTACVVKTAQRRFF